MAITLKSVVPSSLFAAVPCAQCGSALLAPEWSESVDINCVRHLWSCEACSYEFETEVHYPLAAA